MELSNELIRELITENKNMLKTVSGLQEIVSINKNNIITVNEFINGNGTEGVKVRLARLEKFMTSGTKVGWVILSSLIILIINSIFKIV